MTKIGHHDEDGGFMSKLIPKKWLTRSLLLLPLLLLGASFGIVTEEKKFQQWGDRAWTYVRERRVTAELFVYQPTRDVWNFCINKFGSEALPCAILSSQMSALDDFTYPNGRSYDGHY
jgi:hypothetical protein